MRALRGYRSAFKEQCLRICSLGNRVRAQTQAYLHAVFYCTMVPSLLKGGEDSRLKCKFTFLGNLWRMTTDEEIWPWIPS